MVVWSSRGHLGYIHTHAKRVRERNIINRFVIGIECVWLEQCYKLSSTVWLSCLLRTHIFLQSLFPLFFFFVFFSNVINIFPSVFGDSFERKCIDFIAFDHVESSLLLCIFRESVYSWNDGRLNFFHRTR